MCRLRKGRPDEAEAIVRLLSSDTPEAIPLSDIEAVKRLIADERVLVLEIDGVIEAALVAV